MINIIGVSAGAVLFLVSLRNFWQIYSLPLSRSYKPWWSVLFLFVLFFLAGYVAFAAALWNGIPLAGLETLVAQIFFWGAVFVLLVSGFFLLLARGQVTFVSEVVKQRDEVKALKQAEEKEREFNTRISYLSKYANDLIILLDGDFRFLETNERVEDFYGYRRDELIGMHATDLCAPETKAAFAEQIKVVVETGKGFYETVHQRKDGSKFPVEISLRAIDAGGKRLYQAVLRDITDRKEAEKRFQEKMKELKTINDLAVGRELKMIELEKEVDGLRQELGREPECK